MSALCPVCAEPAAVAPDNLGAHCEGMKCPSCGVNARNRFLYQALKRHLEDRVRYEIKGLAARDALERRRPLSVLEASSAAYAATKDRYLEAMRARCTQFFVSDYYQSGFSAALTVDISQMTFPDGSLDVISHAHVLEHVNHDEKAIAEAYRALTHDGVFLFSVPIQTDFTFVPEAPEFHGDNAPVARRNGWDLIRKLKAAGFHVSVLVPPEHLAFKPEGSVRKTEHAIDDVLVGDKFGANFERYRELFYPVCSREESEALGFARIPHQLEIFVARKSFVMPVSEK